MGILAILTLQMRQLRYRVKCPMSPSEKMVELNSSWSVWFQSLHNNPLVRLYMAKTISSRYDLSPPNKMKYFSTEQKLNHKYIYSSRKSKPFFKLKNFYYQLPV